MPPKAKREKEMERHQALGVSFHKEVQIVQTGSFFVFLKRKKEKDVGGGKLI